MARPRSPRGVGVGAAPCRVRRAAALRLSGSEPNQPSSFAEHWLRRPASGVCAVAGETARVLCELLVDHSRRSFGLDGHVDSRSFSVEAQCTSAPTSSYRTTKSQSFFLSFFFLFCLSFFLPKSGGVHTSSVAESGVSEEVLAALDRFASATARSSGYLAGVTKSSEPILKSSKPVKNGRVSSYAVRAIVDRGCCVAPWALRTQPPPPLLARRRAG